MTKKAEAIYHVFCIKKLESQLKDEPNKSVIRKIIRHHKMKLYLLDPSHTLFREKVPY